MSSKIGKFFRWGDSYYKVLAEGPREMLVVEFSLVGALSQYEFEKTDLNAMDLLEEISEAEYVEASVKLADIIRDPQRHAKLSEVVRRIVNATKAPGWTA